MWTQVYSPVAGSLVASAFVAALPIIVLGIMLGVMREPAWRASLAALATALAVGIFAYGMPVGLAATSAVYGAAFGWFPIGWIVFAAILLFDVTVESKCLVAIEQSLRKLSGDDRLQVLLVAFAFGAFIEGTSGFGTPVAISASLLAALGIPAFTAAGLCLVANTAPVAFGALATPIVTLAGVTGLPLQSLSSAVGRLCPPIAMVIPMYLLVLVAGWKKAVEAWPAALVCGLSFALAQFAVSNFVGPYLTDIASALVSFGSLILLLKFWQPATLFRIQPDSAGETARKTDAPQFTFFRAWAPYILLVGLVLVWGTDGATKFFDTFTVRFQVPGLHNAIQRMPPVAASASPYAAVYTFNWLASAGTACFVAALLAALVTGIKPGRLAGMTLGTAKRLVVPELTIGAVLSLAYVMNYSGATATLGLALARTGWMFPFFGTFLGWLGVFLTGSDTSANALFGNLQMISARTLGLSPVLMAAVNSTGGVLGKMISIQSIAVAAAATGMARGSEGKLFMFTLRHSIALTTAMGVLALLFAYAFPAAMPQ